MRRVLQKQWRDKDTLITVALVCTNSIKIVLYENVTDINGLGLSTGFEAVPLSSREADINKYRMFDFFSFFKIYAPKLFWIYFSS